MNREVHVRFCERFRGEIPPLPTRLFIRRQTQSTFFQSKHFPYPFHLE